MTTNIRDGLITGLLISALFALWDLNHNGWRLTVDGQTHIIRLVGK